MYNYGSGRWSSDLPSKNALSVCTSQIRTLFAGVHNYGYVWTGTKESGKAYIAFKLYDDPEEPSLWAYLDSSDRSYKVMLDSL